jgi:hypothetical protein
MKDEKEAAPEGTTQKNTEETAGELPHCTTAPSAEQSRAENEDEPCDDARAGE